MDATKMKVGLSEVKETLDSLHESINAELRKKG